MTTEQLEPDDEELEIPLTETARYSVTLGTTFSYRGNSHWPKVKVEDGPFIVENEEGEALLEDTEQMIFRVEETAHRRLRAIVARMKREIDLRVKEDLERVNHPHPAGETQ